MSVKGALTINQLKDALNGRGYICDTKLVSQVYSSLFNRPTAGAFLFGKAGTGKTFLPHVLSDIFECDTPEDNFFFFQCFPGTREEHLTLQLLPDEDTKSGIKKHEGVIVRAAKASKEKKVILIIDEWDKTRPSADAFMLDFLQNGRIIYGDIHEEANLENMFVFITMNDERHLSEPLIRRMPKIDFLPLHPILVKQALFNSHGDHPYLEPCVTLYRRCQMSKMSKPCTIQELRQLLDAAELLGKSADWDTLVFQYVTKTNENHYLLKQVEGVELKDLGDTDRVKIDEKNFNKNEIIFNEKNEIINSMPKMAKVLGINKKVRNEIKIDLNKAFGVIKQTDDNYNELTKTTKEPNDNPEILEWAEVTGDHFSFSKPIPIEDMDKVCKGLWGQPGEVMLHEPHGTYHDMKLLQEKISDFKITRLSKNEIVGKYNESIDIRWTPNNGLEIIMSLESKEAVTKILSFALSNKYSVIKEFKDLLNQKKCYTFSVYDEWGELQWDKKSDNEIPLISDFIKYAEKKANNIIIKDNSRYYFFDNIAFGFVGPNNDMFALTITGPFDEKLIKYIKTWVPGNKLFFLLRDIKISTINQKDLIGKHGFSFNKDKLNILEKYDKNVVALYDEGILNIGSKFIGENITKENLDNAMVSIDKFITELC